MRVDGQSRAPLPGGPGFEAARLEKAPPPLPGEQAALEQVWGHLAAGERLGRRDLLLPALRALQEARGWVSYPALAAVCRELGLPLAEAYGVASFYALLSTMPGPRHVVHLCDDVACMLRGARELAGVLERLLGPPLSAHGGGGNGDVAARRPGEEGHRAVGWAVSSCLGQCDRAPAALVGDVVLTGLCAGALEEAVRAVAEGRGVPAGAGGEATVAWMGDGTPLLLRRCGGPGCVRLEEYLAGGGYGGLRRALAMGPAATLAEVERSRLVGRGGAAFPTARKWAAAARQPEPRFVVCNADESEPGTFKDRVLLERDPFAVLEGMTIAAFAVGAQKGFVYVRGEYPEAYRVLAAAVEQARDAGYLGRDILGSGFSFDVELRRGAGAYVCGEETALFNSIEGRRGEPRPRPPFPTEAGLFGRPTVINNVETLACVGPILERGGGWYAGLGTAGSAGTKLVSVSGCVRRPGVFEVPFGTPIRAVVEHLAGGVPEGRRVQAVLCGGAAGTLLRPDQLDTPLSFEALSAIGGTVGSGALVVFDDTVDLRAVLERIARFFRDESCGQCVPCRVGTQRQWELVAALASRQRRPDEAAYAMLADLARVMRDASICGLGQLAAAAVQSGLHYLGFENNRDTGR